MNTKRNLLYKRLFALSLTGALLSSPVSVLASQKNDADNEHTRTVSPQNAVLLSKIKEIVTTANANSNVAIENVINNTFVDIAPELEAAVEAINDAAENIEAAAADITDSAAELEVAIAELEAEVEALADVVADIPTLDEFNAAISAIEGDGFDTDTDSLKILSDKIDLIQGSGFDTDDDSLKVISDKIDVLGSAPLATLANQTTQGLVALATSAQAVAIQGTGFDTSTDSLKVISDNQSTQGVVALATNAQAASVLANQATQGLVPLATSAQAVAIQGTGFDTSTDSLKVISDNQGTQGLVPLATSAQASDIQGGSFLPGTGSLMAITNKIGTPANTGGTATVAGILGDPGLATGVPGSTLADMLGNIDADIADLPTNAELATALAPLATLANQTTQGLVPLATSAQAVAIQGTGFDTSTDSLKVISDNQSTQGVVALATNAQATSVLANQSTQGLVALATSAQASDIQGAGFDTVTDSLVAIANNVTLVPLATNAQAVSILANQSTQGLVALATSAQAVDIQGRIGAPIRDGVSSTISLILGDPVVNGVASSIVNLIGDPNDAIVPGTSIVDILSDIEGSGFVSATDSLKVISDNIGDLAGISGLYAQTAAIQGAGFVSGTDSLKIISDNQSTQGLVALATNAQVNNLGTSSDTSGLYGLLTTIVGLLTTDPVLAVTYAKASAALTTTLTVSGGASPATYNANLTTALTAITTATTFATQSQTNTATAITNLNTAIGDFNTLITGWGAGPTPISSAYSEAEISGALSALKNALLTLQSAQAAV